MAEEPQGLFSRTRYQISESFHTFSKQFRDVQRRNLSTFRAQPLQEISGSFGDLGTLLPLLIALSSSYFHPIDLGSTLVFTGLANIATGLFFGVPLPVQPMKAIAAAALSRMFNQEEMAAAGLWVAAAIGILTVSGLIGWFNRQIPVPVIKGIQMGVGLSLIIYAGSLLTPNYQDGLQISLALVGFLGLLLYPSFAYVPMALILLLLGIVVGLPNLIDRPAGLNIWRPHVFAPSIRIFGGASLDAAVGQVPLTALNSIIAVAALSADLLPEAPAPTTYSIGLSVTVINLAGCWFGCMPVCHGSGGLAAQYRFGARSGASVVFLGLVKLLLGLFAGRLAKRVFEEFPAAILGIMVVAAGLELVSVGESLNQPAALDSGSSYSQDQRDPTNDSGVDAKTHHDLTERERKRRWTTMFMTIGGMLALKNDAIGFIAGMLCHWSFQLQDRIEARRAQREGTIQLLDEDGEGRQTAAP
ncbi:MAG: hypothetical protein LQ351_005102 [Letrouitia transgressa]|nr:MAG: hypothetical protein LQ351_005102 [Letrouitia transgressa]